MIPIYACNSPEIEGYLARTGARGTERHSQVEMEVAAIIGQVRKHGDSALFELTRKFDGAELGSLRIDPSEVGSLARKVPGDLRHILLAARENIRNFHLHQLEKSWEFEAGDGVRLGQKVSPLRSVGIYVPGGKAAYPSTVLMNAIPAQIAGVKRIAVATPYRKFAENPILAAVFEELGLTEIYGVGGAQAIAALAYGTSTIPQVDKIVGPGNLYVATAKRQVFGQVDIDMVAGPTEVVVVAEMTVNPDFVAADLMAQAEHDEEACAIAVTFSKEFALTVRESLARQIRNLNREKIIRRSLEEHGAILICSNLQEAAELVNTIAPEHLELLMGDPEPFAEKIHSAGAIFFGVHSCEPVGDYFAGPNHVLPTSGTARFASPLGVYDFVKRTSIIKYTREALETHHLSIETFALAENLDAHAHSVRVRIGKSDDGS